MKKNTKQSLHNKSPMKKFLPSLLTILLVILVIGFHSIPVSAKNALAIDIPLFTQTQNMDQPRNTTSFWFSVPEGTILSDGCSLNLNITTSDTLINERSSITFSVNGTTLETYHLLTIANDNNKFLTIDIPKELLRTGSLNELTITSTQRSIEGDCADIDNPSNWINIHEDSYFHVSIADYGKPTLSGFYNYFYNSITSIADMQHEFILGNSGSAVQINSMLQTASSVGANAPYRNYLQSSVSSGASTADLSNHIYIGLLNNYTTLPFTLPSSLNKENGYLAVNGTGTQNNMLITADTDEGLKKAVNFVADNTYLEQLKTDRQVISTSLPAPETTGILNQEGYYTLEDFGYSSTNLAGAFHQRINYTISQPNGLKSGTNSYIEILFKHSKALVADNSLMTVSIDNMPQGSVKLSSSNAEEGKIKVRIPSDALSKESFILSIECYNYIGKIDCSKDYYDTAWTYIDGASVVYLEPGDTGFRPTLMNFPVFPVTQKNSPVTLVMPEAYDNNMLALASMISTRAAQNSPDGLLWDAAIGCDSLTEYQKQNHLIFVGSFDKASLPDELADRLNILPNGDGSFLLRDGISVSAETLEDKIIFQSIRSPWNYARRIYVILYPAGTDKQSVKTLTHLLSDREFINNMQGHVALTKDGEAFTNFSFSGDTEAASKIPLTKERIFHLLEKYTGVSIWGLLIILLLVILVIILTIRIMKNKNRFSKAAAKMALENNTASAVETDDDEQGIITVEDILKKQKENLTQNKIDSKRELNQDLNLKDDFDI